MNQFDDEFAARQNRRLMESLQESPVTDRIVDAADATGVAAAVGSALVPPLGVALVPVGIAASALGAFSRALRLGKPTAKKMVEDLESDTVNQIRRIWSRLDKDTERQSEFEARLNSSEGQLAMLNECFHGLKSSDRAKHTRLAIVTVNSVLEGDLGEESLDTLMRAAVELKQYDLDLLADVYAMQIPFILADHWAAKDIGEKWNILAAYWQKYWDQNQKKYRGLEGSRFIGSFSRLEALGMIAPGPNRSSALSPVATCYLLLPDGIKFHERLQKD